MPFELTQQQYDALTPQEKASIEKRIPEPLSGQAKMTGLEYLNSIGAGASAIQSYVEEDRSENRLAMTAVADMLFEAGVDASLVGQLFEAGVPASEIVGVAHGYVLASGEARAQVQGLLALT